MKRADAEVLMQQLVAGTQGWAHATDETLDVYLSEIVAWKHDDCAKRAIDNVVRTWTSLSRPPLAWVIQAYNNEVGAKLRTVEQLQAAARPADDHHVSAEEGMKIAARAFEQAYGRPLGSEPVPDPERVRAIIRQHGRESKGRIQCRFIDIVNNMRGDQAVARVSLAAVRERRESSDGIWVSIPADPVAEA